MHVHSSKAGLGCGLRVGLTSHAPLPKAPLPKAPLPEQAPLPKAPYCSQNDLVIRPQRMQQDVSGISISISAFQTVSNCRVSISMLQTQFEPRGAPF